MAASGACRLALAGALLALVACLPPAAGQAGWREGRATFYGNEPWLWSIHHGSCGRGYVWPDQGPTGWDVAALADTHPAYPHSCGACFELKCSPATITDGFGEELDRNGACRDPEASVVVSITDTCPCVYPANAASNKRWCCGDMDHMDLSIWAFQKLSTKRQGVIPIRYRRVDCDHTPDKQAVGRPVSTPEFPPLWQAKQRPDFAWTKYFPQGGHLNTLAGDGQGKISVTEYLERAGVSGGDSDGEAATPSRRSGRSRSRASSSSSSSTDNTVPFSLDKLFFG